jgi:Domain of unknown function (DUF2017)
MTGSGPDDFPVNGDDGLNGNGAFGGEPADRGAMDDDVLDDFGADPDEAGEGELAATFRPIPGGAACYFAPAQAGVIRSLVGQVAELIRTEMGSPPGDLTTGGPGDVTAGDPETGPPSLDSAAPEDLEKMLGLSGNAELPDDPVLARLLPDAYSDDPDASAEFRRYTEETLRAGKINSAQAVLASLPAGGGDVVLSEPECQHWLKALNDVRLALGVRLGITDEEQDLTEDLSASDPRSAYIWVYQWLAYLQDSLIESLS